MDGYEEARWSRFCGWLLSYIEDYYSPFFKVDYEIELDDDVTMGDIVKELQTATSISELSSQLQKIARQFRDSNDAFDNDEFEGDYNVKLN